MTFREMRVLHTRLMAELKLWIFQQEGYEVATAEGMDRITEKDPTSDHMKNSNHNYGLAEDLDLYLNGNYMKKTEDHKFVGDKWKSMHPLCRWGGDLIKHPDGNHYSLEYQGRV